VSSIELPSLVILKERLMQGWTVFSESGWHWSSFTHLSKLHSQCSSPSSTADVNCLPFYISVYFRQWVYLVLCFIF